MSDSVEEVGEDAGARSVDRSEDNCWPKGVGMGEAILTLWRELRRLGLLLKIAPSSNGKTADSGSAYRGSNPCGAAGPYRLTVQDAALSRLKYGFDSR